MSWNVLIWQKSVWALLSLLQIPQQPKCWRGILIMVDHQYYQKEPDSCEDMHSVRSDHNRQMSVLSPFYRWWGFSGSSAGKEAICNAGDLGLITGSGRFPWRRDRLHTSVFLDFTGDSVKNLPAMQDTWVQSLGWEDPLEKGKATQFSILAWRTAWTWPYSP